MLSVQIRVLRRQAGTYFPAPIILRGPYFSLRKLSGAKRTKHPHNNQNSNVCFVSDILFSGRIRTGASRARFTCSHIAQNRPALQTMFQQGAAQARRHHGEEKNPNVVFSFQISLLSPVFQTGAGAPIRCTSGKQMTADCLFWRQRTAAPPLCVPGWGARDTAAQNQMPPRGERRATAICRLNLMNNEKES